MRTILQVPMDKKLKDKAKKYIEYLGFDSLQSYIRFVLTQTVNGRTNINFQKKSEININDIKQNLKK